eukprot:TRINITY_DN11714_c0_g1_i1.p1 TRINITY_DN11714_c0_g1~~TRINITY_DN11714_c0_g1_i1.p1  ORF type:complete len:297 (+),score=35.18 TRINITY_DN11714_c0_g1_i1:76-966(+)
MSTTGYHNVGKRSKDLLTKGFPITYALSVSFSKKHNNGTFSSQAIKDRKNQLRLSVDNTLSLPLFGLAIRTSLSDNPLVGFAGQASWKISEINFALDIEACKEENKENVLEEIRTLGFKSEKIKTNYTLAHYSKVYLLSSSKPSVVGIHGIYTRYNFTLGGLLEGKLNQSTGINKYGLCLDYSNTDLSLTAYLEKGIKTISDHVVGISGYYKANENIEIVGDLSTDISKNESYKVVLGGAYQASTKCLLKSKFDFSKSELFLSYQQTFNQFAALSLFAEIPKEGETKYGLSLTFTG